MSKHNRFVAIVLVLCAAVLLVLPAGCKQRKSDKPRIALVMKSLANEFFKTMEDGARAHHAEHAGKYDLKADGIKNELDVAQQVRIVELTVAQGVDAINKFDAAVLADKGVSIPFVGPDNRKGARLAGEHLAKKLKAGDKVAIIEGAPNTFNGIQRKLGFEDAMKAAGMDVVSSQSGYWEMAKANQVVSAILTEHLDLKALLCANDSMALGAIAATKAAGKSDDILIAGFDNISAVQQLLKEGSIVCTIDQHADKLAIYGIEYALEMLAEKGVPADRETPVDLITAETLR
ncbi:MAG: substrate-binding domain-containing protein [Planctomycetota bacterium]